MRIYLAGPIRGLTYDETMDWRDYAADVLRRRGHVAVSPMRGKEFLKTHLGGEVIATVYEEFPLASEAGIYGRDIFDVAHCEVLLANFENAKTISLGTCMEIQAARDRGQYVLVVLEEAGNPNDHPFVRRAASLVVTNLEVALGVLTVLGEPYRHAITLKGA